MKVLSAEFVLSAASVDALPRNGLPEVAFLGPSNVGKSSLVNMMLGRKAIARVSKTPGRTQHLNVFRINDALHVVDLPGYGFAKVPRAVQAEFLRLVSDYLARSAHLVLLVLLLDARREPSERDVELRRQLVAGRVPHVVALTKSDKLGAGALAASVRSVREALGQEGGPLEIQPTSAESGLGKRELWALVDSHLAAARAASRPT